MCKTQVTPESSGSRSSWLSHRCQAKGHGHAQGMLPGRSKTMRPRRAQRHPWSSEKTTMTTRRSDVCGHTERLAWARTTLLPATLLCQKQEPRRTRRDNRNANGTASSGDHLWTHAEWKPSTSPTCLLKRTSPRVPPKLRSHGPAPLAILTRRAAPCPPSSHARVGGPACCEPCSRHESCFSELRLQ